VVVCHTAPGDRVQAAILDLATPDRVRDMSFHAPFNYHDQSQDLTLYLRSHDIAVEVDEILVRHGLRIERFDGQHANSADWQAAFTAHLPAQLQFADA
jgi:hypothetical protein